MDNRSAVNILLERSELKVRSARRFTYASSYLLRRRSIPDYDLVLIGKGSGAWEYEGAGRLPTRPGTALLLTPHAMHGTAGRLAGPYELISIHFDLSIERGWDFFKTVPFLPAVHVPQWKRLYVLAGEVCREWARDGALGRSLLVHDLTRALLVEVIRLHQARATTSIATDQRILQVLQMIDEHYSEPLTVQDMGRWVGLSAAHLRDLFRVQLRLTPTAALLGRRMRQARSLLLGTTLSIKQIAAAVGFADPLYFSRVFRRCEGMPAIDFRQSAKNP